MRCGRAFPCITQFLGHLTHFCCNLGIVLSKLMRSVYFYYSVFLATSWHIFVAKHCLLRQVFKTLARLMRHGRAFHYNTQFCCHLGDLIEIFNNFRALLSNATAVVDNEHQCFYDTDMLDVPDDLRPNWMGTVRDPIDRFASWYYYRSSLRPGKVRPELHLNYTDFDQCCLSKHEDCFPKEGTANRFQYSFFCGTALECFQYNYRPALEVFNCSQAY